MVITKPPEGYSVMKESALVISLLLNCVNLIGFVSTGWAVPLRDHDPNFEGLGLWKYCSYYTNDVVTCIDTKDLVLPSWFKATQAFSTLSFICMVAAFFTIVISECNKKLRENMYALLVFSVLAFLAPLFGVVATSLFGVSVDDYPLDLPGEEENTYFKVSWSYICCAIASLAHTVTVYLGVAEYAKMKVKKKYGTNPLRTDNTRMDQSFSPYTSFPEFPEIPPPSADSEA